MGILAWRGLTREEQEKQRAWDRMINEEIADLAFAEAVRLGWCCVRRYRPMPLVVRRCGWAFDSDDRVVRVIHRGTKIRVYLHQISDGRPGWYVCRIDREDSGPYYLPCPDIPSADELLIRAE